MTKDRESSKARGNVISVRLDDASIEVLDLLVQSGLLQSRSEAAAQLIAIGIQSAEDLLQQAKSLADNLQRIKKDMIAAVKSRDVSRVKELLGQDETLANTKTESGESPLLLSVYYGAKDVTDYLLNRGVELNMFEAASIGNTQKLQEFLQVNPEAINDYSGDGWTALALAAFFGHKETAEWLLNNGADLMKRSTNAMDNTPLHAALAGRRTEVAKLLVEHGADINNVAGGGWTPLHLAAANGDAEMVDILLTREAQFNLKNDDGHTPLALAEQYKHENIAESLRSKGAVI
ncbi:MAG: ankyrin repeat domain-containing protein [Tumebacillaceae bacterium]